MDGVEEDVLLEGEPAGVSIIRIWAKRLAITFVVAIAVGGLAITWILQENLENVIQAIVQ